MRITSEQILSGPLGPTLYKMTMPMVIGILAMMTFGAVDTFFVSRLGSEPLAAISFTIPVGMVLLNLTLGLCVGASVQLGSAIGRGDRQAAARISTDSILFALLLVISISVAGYLSIDPLFSMLGATALTLPLIHEYMDIYYLFFGLMVVPMLGNALIRGTGDTRWPSMMMMASGLINMVLDPILIFGWGPIPEMGVRGAAWATVISWLVGTVATLWILYRRENLLLFSLPPMAKLFSYWGSLAKIGLPISLANIMMPLALAAVTRLVSDYGEIAVAGLGAGTRLESFAMVVPFAITSALSPFMAQNIGAGNPLRAHQALVTCISFILKFQFLIFAVFCGGGYWLAMLFSNDPEVVQVTRYYLWIAPLGMAFYSTLIVLNTAFNAEQRSDRTLLISSLRILVFYIPLAWLGGWWFGLPGIFAGGTLGNLLASAVGWVIYLKTRPQLVAEAA